MKIVTKILVATFGLTFSMIPLHADIIWPALILTGARAHWSVIIIGLILEFPFIKLITKFRVLKAIYATFVVNIFSTLLGWILIPFAGGIIWEVLTKLAQPYLGDPSDIMDYLGTYIVAALISTLTELIILRCVCHIKMLKKNFYWLLLANLLSTGVALLSLALEYYYAIHL